LPDPFDAWTERYRQERAHADWSQLRAAGLPRLVAHVLFAARTYGPPAAGRQCPRYIDLMRVVYCSRGTVERAIRVLRAKGHLPVNDRVPVVARVQAALRTSDAVPGSQPSSSALARLVGCSKVQAWRAVVFLRDGGELRR
jgi:hypothetical protein